MGEKVDLMNEENREQTGGKRRVYGEQGAHSGCIIGTRTHRYHFPHSSGAAATLASLDMQSGPISSSVCRKWHVPPEEAQKQRQCPQPAINHAFVSHCVCSFGHIWIMGSLVINSNLKLYGMEFVLLSRKISIFASIALFSRQYIAVKLTENTRQTAAVRCVLLLIQSISRCQTVSCKWNPSPHTSTIKSNSRRIQCYLCCREHRLVFYSMGHFICRSSRTEGSKCICNEWNCTLDLDQYIGFILTLRSHWIEITTDLCQWILYLKFLY